MLILCTGSQGEPLSALTRIAYDDHPAVTVERGDTVIISAKPIPGNELRVHDAINRLTKDGRRGAPRGERARARLGPRQRRGAADDPRAAAAAGRHARPRRVPDARRARAARARRRASRRSRSCSPRTAPSSSSRRAAAPRIVDQVEAGVTFVDGLGVGDVAGRRAARPAPPLGGRRPDRRRDARGVERRRGRRAGADRARLRSSRARCSTSCARRPARVLDECLRNDVREIKLLQEHLHDGVGQLIYDRTRRRPMILRSSSRSEHLRRVGPAGPDVLEEHGATRRRRRRLVAQLRACEVAALAFCRLLERWARGEAEPATPAHRARRRCGAPPTGPRRRSPGSRRRSAATSSSSSPSAPRAARGTASRAPPSCSSGSRCSCRAGVQRLAGARRAGLPRAGGARARARRASRRRPDRARARTARPSGPGSSTSARTCSAAPSAICARSPREPVASRVVGGRRTSTSSRARSGCRGPGRRVTGAELRPRPGRQGREPGRRGGAARRRRALRRLRRARRLRAAGARGAARRTACGSTSVAVDAPTGIALIVVDAAGENQIVVAPGANARLRPEHVGRRRRGRRPVPARDPARDGRRGGAAGARSSA